MSSRRRHGAGHRKYKRTVAGQPSYRLGARVLLGKRLRLDLTAAEPCLCRCHSGKIDAHPDVKCRCNAGTGYQS